MFEEALETLKIGDSILVENDGNQVWMNVTDFDEDLIFGFDIDDDSHDTIIVNKCKIIDVFNEETANKKYHDILRAMLSEELGKQMSGKLRSVRCSESGQSNAKESTQTNSHCLHKYEEDNGQRSSFCGIWAEKLGLIMEKVL